MIISPRALIRAISGWGSAAVKQGRRAGKVGDGLSGEAKGQPRLLDQVRQTLRVGHDSIHTEWAYVDWIVRFVRFHGMRSREDLFPGEAKFDVMPAPDRRRDDRLAALRDRLFHELDYTGNSCSGEAVQAHGNRLSIRRGGGADGGLRRRRLVIFERGQRRKSLLSSPRDRQRKE